MAAKRLFDRFRQTAHAAGGGMHAGIDCIVGGMDCGLNTVLGGGRMAAEGALAFEGVVGGGAGLGVFRADFGPELGGLLAVDFALGARLDDRRQPRLDIGKALLGFLKIECGRD